MAANRNQNAVHIFQGGTEAPTGFQAVVQPSFTKATWVADVERHLRNLHKCGLFHKCLHADLWDGYHVDEFLAYLATLYQPLCANLTSLCAHVLKVTPQDLLLSGNVDNQALTSSLLLCNPSTTTRTITGFAAIEGAMVKVENLGTVDLVLSHQGGTSDAANRMISPTGFDLTVSPNDGVWIAYDSTSDRWRINA